MLKPFRVGVDVAAIARVERKYNTGYLSVREVFPRVGTRNLAALPAL